MASKNVNSVDNVHMAELVGDSKSSIDTIVFNCTTTPHTIVDANVSKLR